MRRSLILSAGLFLLPVLLSGCGATLDCSDRAGVRQSTVTVSIMGNVQSNGRYAVPSNASVMDLLEAAGGPSDYAKAGPGGLPPSVRIMRSDGMDRGLVLRIRRSRWKDGLQGWWSLQEGDLIEFLR